MSEWSPGIQKVLDHVAMTEGWSLDVGQRVRRGGIGRGLLACPITSMDNADCFDWEDIARSHGLSMEDANLIVEAADDPRPDVADQGELLRAALLRAARLA